MFSVVVFERDEDKDGMITCVDRVDCETDEQVCKAMNEFCCGKTEDKWPTEKYIHLIYEGETCVYSDAD